MQVYDPLSDKWGQGADLPVGKAGLSSCVVNGKIYAIGGTPVPHPCVATSTVYEYDGDIAYAPSADFNGNGQVDVNDLVRMIESWGQDDPLVDLGPCACSDGTVDVEDLEILVSQWGQKAYDSTLMAHWALDETEGDVARDLAHDHDGLLIGDPVWQPDAGRVDGALQFDGVDDYVELPYSPNPRREVFSVFAWVGNAAAGEVILSQATGDNWLLIDSDGDSVITELTDPFWPCGPLEANVSITDSDWHRVGLVWDGTHRTLYVDDVGVARDEEPIAFPVGASGHLCIGCGADQSPDTFFSGRIDDVRIYNRAVRP